MGRASTVKVNRQLIRRLAALVAGISIVATVLASAASAGQVVGYGPFGMPTIVVDTGPKNYASHTQWVRSIYIETPGHCDGGTAEAWTAGFYVARQICGRAFFYINRWVRSGNGVCARVWVYAKRGFGPGYTWQQSTACISIKV
jgi:hypothetical protein